MRKRILSLLLCVVMLFSLCPQSALAVGNEQTGGVTIGTSGLCEHHPEHDADCGYTEGTAGTSCGHEHTEDCYVEVTNCVHEHDEDCYPAGSVSGNEATPSGAQKREPENCPHICDEESGCIAKELNCHHEHDGECGYSPAIEGTPCGYVCELCGGEDNGEAGKQPEAECICTTLCTTEAITVALAADPVTDVSYLDETGTSQTCASATEVTSSDTGWTTGWYVATGNITIGTAESPQRVTITGDVRLILTDGCTLTVNGGIQVQDNSTESTPNTNALTIYAQSTDKSTMGKLIATGAKRDNNAVIGGNGGNSYGGSCGTIIINGGTVTATSTGYGAAIGGGYGIFTGGSGGTITINGGNINASNQIGAGIGGGEGGGDGGSGGEITINGGSVIATGVNGAGIGGGQGDGDGGSGGEITINGGSVIATGVNGAAIGGGYSGGGTGGDGGTITITGGSVIATGNDNGAGIGSGYGTRGGSGGEVMITGGTVKASSSRGAGIGVGYSDSEIGNSGTFQTNNGNAVIFASSIGDQSGKTSNAWHGIIFEGDAAGIIYGESVAPTDDFTIPTGKTLTIPDGVTMTVNSRITVNGTLANNGTIIGSGSITPEEKKLTYKAAPSTPVIVSVSADSITLQPIVGETAVEYSKDNTKWQSETTFSGLTAATSYTFYARYQENGFYKDPSPQSDGSDPAYTAYTAPDTNGGYFIDYAAETITVSDGYEVNTDSGFGTGTVVTSGSTVTPGQTFHVRKAASGDIPASEGTEFTIPARPDAPAAPTVKSKTSGSVTLEVILGAQYSMDGGATWQDSPEFTGLSASTAYRFVARYGATESRFASLASAELNVTTNAALSGGGYTYYTIKATAGVNGAISPSGSVSVREGRNQTFTITPNTGYAISNVKIDGKSVGAVKSYTFENVKGNHTIEAIFMKANGNPQTGVFVDVPEGSYYEEAVAWAVENGITQGTDDTHFSPDGICTRAQAVTFLWRTAGSPASKTSAMPFTDVPVGSYYYDAVLWAVENGITKGTSETRFSPDDTCTRAQIVAFLWRSEKSPAAGSRNPFADVKSTAYYADAVLWAVKEDITKGSTNTTFSPDADCTRAQIVTFLWRCKK